MRLSRLYLCLFTLIAMTTACGTETADTSSAKPPGLAATNQTIVNGEEATASGFRSTVALLLQEDSSYICTGTLVSPQVVVSAAHCFDSTTPGDYAIGYNTLTGISVPADKQAAVKKVVVHSSYAQVGSPTNDPSGVSRDNDIAIVLLSNPITDMPATPILPQGELSNRLTAGATLTISGYGINDEATQSEGTLHVGRVPFKRHNGYELLAGNRNSTDSCNGDSGGPAYLETDTERFLVGITSRAAHDAEKNCGDGGIYTLASGYINWIASKAEGLYTASASPDADADDGGSDGDNNAADEEDANPEDNFEDDFEDNPEDNLEDNPQDSFENDFEDGECVCTCNGNEDQWDDEENQWDDEEDKWDDEEDKWDDDLDDWGDNLDEGCPDDGAQQDQADQYEQSDCDSKGSDFNDEWDD